MNEKRIELLIEELKKQIKESNKMFHNDDISKAYVVGYLQGTIHTAIAELDEVLEEQKRLS